MHGMPLAKQDQDAIDFTDNDITTLTNFPLSPRLHTLLLARNRVTTIAPTLFKTIPNLTTLVLTHNHIVELADLDALSSFAQLTHLVLIENPVASKEVRGLPPTLGCNIVGTDSPFRSGITDAFFKPLFEQHYRYWVLWRCARVRFLDFVKVKDGERKKANELFGTINEPTALASKVG